MDHNITTQPVFEENANIAPDLNQALGDAKDLLDSILNDQFYESMQLQAGEKLVVAMSGGVDSSVTAALLHHAGYEIVGLTLQLYNHGAAVSRKGACCAGQDIYDAKQAAAKLGIPHYVMDMETQFRQAVIDDFADSYARGETPVPCIRCNQSVKFHDLLGFAKSLGAKALATGHYIERGLNDNNIPWLRQGHDLKKDQSYFLFATTKPQLDFLRFPLGGINKAQTRQLALYFGLDIAEKPDSQDICFVPNGNYADIVQKLRPDAFIPGDIVDMDGNILGHHNGIANYTIGQRKGLGIGGRADNDQISHGKHPPLYVVRLDAVKARVIVGSKHDLACHKILLNQVNWLGEQALSKQAPLDIWVKIRSVMQPVRATLTLNQIGDVHIIFEQAQYGVSAGQACVFYEDQADLDQTAQAKLKMLGGGWIVDRIT
ncbi:MAG: tRNA 2-thiouridine(34) synthase MnmA [Alphaproteobacteria bacterium]